MLAVCGNQVANPHAYHPPQSPEEKALVLTLTIIFEIGSLFAIGLALVELTERHKIVHMHPSEALMLAVASAACFFIVKTASRCLIKKADPVGLKADQRIHTLRVIQQFYREPVIDQMQISYAKDIIRQTQVEFKQMRFCAEYLDQLKETRYKKNLTLELSKKNAFFGYEKRGPSLIPIPNDSVLKWRAKHYLDKYQIIIIVIPPSKLLALIRKLEQELKAPTYFAVVSLATVTMDGIRSTSTSHVTPFVFYVAPSEATECVMMDTKGFDPMIHHYYYTLLRIPDEHFYYTITPRQGDIHACRTAAPVLCRNALLSLNFHKCTGGFRQVFKEGQCSGQQVNYLPPEWDYVEQVTNQCLKDHHLAIRSCYSKKGKQEVKAVEFRKKYAAVAKFHYTIWQNQPATYLSLPSQLPKGVSFLHNTSCWSLEFTMKRHVNTYLQKKAERIEASVKKMQRS